MSATLVGLAAMLLFFATAFTGHLHGGYRHVRHTISELGAHGTQSSRLVSTGVFLPVGVLLAVAAYLAWTTAPEAALLCACIATGYLSAAVFPCDVGSPMTGSTRQQLHNLGGAVEYLGGAYALYALYAVQGEPYRLAAVVVVVALVGIGIDNAWRGLIQRIAEFTLFAALLMALIAA